MFLSVFLFYYNSENCVRNERRVFLSTVFVCGSASPSTIGIGGTVALWKAKGYLAGLALDGNIIG